MGEDLLVERVDRVVIARLNRPAARNALNLAVVEALAGIIDATSDDPTVSVLMLGTTDVRAFSAGMDLKETGSAREQLSLAITDLSWRLAAYLKPIVATLPGYVIGGGAEVALGADIRIGDGTTQFRFPGTGYGLAQGSWHLVETVGSSWARQIVLTGRLVDAEEAAHLGLVHELADDADARGRQVARELAQRHDGAMAQTKRLMLAASGRTLKERFDEESLLAERMIRAAQFGHGSVRRADTPEA
jgi:enoyl-CoA hydratase/carnithine racemase